MYGIYELSVWKIPFIHLPHSLLLWAKKAMIVWVSMVVCPSSRIKNFILYRLIVLGLDQFWRYIEQNPDLFPPPSAKHPRHRWGLTATIRLVTKHMFPWITPRWMLLHVSKGRKDKDGPIYVSIVFNTRNCFKWKV